MIALISSILGDFSYRFLIIFSEELQLMLSALFFCIPLRRKRRFLLRLLAGFLAPLMTEAALSNISLVGNILITCVGVNLVWSKTIRVANLLPALVIAVIFALV